ncbi:golgin subfamily B member 1 isoform X2 [Lingula anatina]|uniref:Golgin subfamily B member 1 isoform X2 n=1 Tax=Lingula anatina TaxID=7574 RepID=A0A1S3H2P1_LINAN|nr:golgin subfamily B member 1 isoform X2 [Lingula anatina]|eukprot:XP_013380212.1 golgin subfamily B member 1 isoform X2 [Lingula anatina]
MSLFKFVRKRREIEDELKALRIDNSHLLEENHELQERLQHENGQLQFDLHGCRQDKERLEKEKASLEDNKSQLMNNVSGLIRQNNTLQKEANESKDEYLELKSKYDEIKNKLNEVQREKQDLETYASQTEEAIARLSHDRDNLQRQTMELEEDIRTIKLHQSQSQVQAVHVTQKQAQPHVQTSTASAQLADLGARFSREKARLEEEIEHLKEELADRDRSSINRHLESAVNDLTLEKERLQRENSRLMDERRQKEKLLAIPKPPPAEREDSVTRELEELITRLTEEKDRLQLENRQLIEHQETSSVTKINIKLEGTVTQLMEERHQLEEENQRLRVELESAQELTEETQLLRDELDKARVNAEQFHVQLDHLTSRLEKEQAQVLQSNRELSEQCEKQKHRVAELESEIATLTEGNARLKDQNESLEGQVREILSQLQDTSQKDKSDVVQLTETVSRLTVENNALLNDNQQLRDHHTSEATQFKEEMEKINKMYKLLEKNKEDEIHDLQSLVKSQQEERQELLSKLEIQEKDAIKMREDYDLRIFHLHTEKIQLEARIGDAEENLASVKASVSDTQTQTPQEQEVKVHRGVAEEHKESIHQLTAVIDKLKEERGHLQNQNRELECRIDEISLSLSIEKDRRIEDDDETKSQLEKQEKEISSLKEENSSLNKQLSELREIVDQLEEGLPKFIDSADCALESEDIRTEVIQLREQHLRLLRVLSENKTGILPLMPKEATVKQSILSEEDKAELESLRLEVVDLRRRLKENRDEQIYEELQRDVGTEMDAEVLRVEQEVTDLRSKILTMEKSLEVANVTIADVTSQLQKASDEENKLKANISALNEENEKLKEENMLLHHRIMSVQQTTGTSLEQTTDGDTVKLIEERHQLEESNVQLRKEIELLQTTCPETEAALEKNIEKLRTENENLKEKLMCLNKELEERVKELTNENFNLQTKLKEIDSKDETSGNESLQTIKLLENENVQMRLDLEDVKVKLVRAEEHLASTTTELDELKKTSEQEKVQLQERFTDLQTTNMKTIQDLTERLSASIAKDKMQIQESDRQVSETQTADVREDVQTQQTQTIPAQQKEALCQTVGESHVGEKYDVTLDQLRKANSSLSEENTELKLRIAEAEAKSLVSSWTQDAGTVKELTVTINNLTMEKQRLEDENKKLQRQLEQIPTGGEESVQAHSEVYFAAPCVVVEELEQQTDDVDKNLEEGEVTAVSSGVAEAEPVGKLDLSLSEEEMKQTTQHSSEQLTDQTTGDAATSNEDENEELRTTNDRLAEAKMRLEKENADLRSQFEHFKCHAEELTEQLHNSFALFEAEKERFFSEKQSMTTEYEQVISELSKENYELKRKRAELVHDLSDSTKELADMNAHLQDDKQRIQGEYDKLAKKFEAHEAQAIQTKNQMEISVARMINQIEALEKKNKELTDGLKAEDEDAVKYRAELEETARKLNDERLRIDAMQGDKAHLLDIIRQLESSNKQLSDLLKKYSGDAAATDTQLRTAVLAMQDEKTRIDNLEKEKFQLMEIMEQYEEQSEVLINSLRSDKKRLNEENDDLRNELEEMYALLRGGENDAIDILAEKEAEIAIIKACRSIEDEVFKTHLAQEAKVAKERAAAIERQTNKQIKDQYQSQLDDLERDVFNKDLRNQQLELLLSKVEEELQMEKEINEEICKEIQKLQEVSTTGEIEPIVERIMVKKTIAHLTKEERGDSQDISTTDEDEEITAPEVTREERKSIRDIMSGLETLKEESENVDVHRLMEENRLLVKRMTEFQTLREENERLTEELHTLRSGGLEFAISQELDSIKRDNERLIQEMDILRANMEEASEESVLSMRADVMRVDDVQQEAIPRDEIELKKKYQVEDLENKLQESEFSKLGLEHELKKLKEKTENEKHDYEQERNSLNQQITELSIQVHEREMSIAMLGQQIENLRARSDDTVETDRAVIQTISHENEILKSKLSESVKLVENERRLKDEINQMLKEENEKNMKLNKEMVARKNELQNMSLQLASTDKELETIQLIAERFEKTYANVEETIGSLQNENISLKKTIEQLKEHQRNLDQELDRMKQQQASEASVDNEQNRVMIIELEQEISNLQGYLEDRNKLHETCKELKCRLESTEQELVQTKETSEKECQDLRNKIKELTEQSAHAQIEQTQAAHLYGTQHEHLALHDQVHKIEKLERRVKEMEDIIDDLERENDLLRKEKTAEESGVTLRELVESVSDMPDAEPLTSVEQVRRDSLREQIQYEKEFQKMDSKILQLHQENASLHEILRQQEIEIASADISSDREVSRDSPDGEREDLENKIADLTCETSLLQEMLKQKEEHFMFELEACNRQKVVETKWLQDKCEALEADRSELQAEIMRLQVERTFDEDADSNEKEQLQIKIDELLKKSTDLTSELNKREQAHAQEIRDLNIQMEKAKSQFDTTVTALSNENRALQEKIKAIQAKPGKNGKGGKGRADDQEVIDLKRRLEAAKSQKEDVEKKFKELKDNAKDQKKKAVDEVRKERSKEFDKMKKELAQRDEHIAGLQTEMDGLRTRMESQQQLLENKYSRDHLNQELENLRVDMEKSFAFEMEAKQEEIELLHRKVQKLERDSSDSERSSGSSRETSPRKHRSPKSPTALPPSSPLHQPPSPSRMQCSPSPPIAIPSHPQCPPSPPQSPPRLASSPPASPSLEPSTQVKEIEEERHDEASKAEPLQSSSGSDSANHDGSYGDVDTKDDDLSGTAEGFSEVRRKRRRRKRKSTSSPK